MRSRSPILAFLDYNFDLNARLALAILFWPSLAGLASFWDPPFDEGTFYLIKKIRVASAAGVFWRGANRTIASDGQ
jgi:hypothetical protein